MTAAAGQTETADLAVHAAWVIPVEPDERVLERHGVVIRDGRIVAVLPSDEARRCFDARAVIELPSHVLIPGLINAHTHAASALLRGSGINASRIGWSGAQARPVPAYWTNEELVRDGSELAIACMLRSGTTCFSAAGLFPGVTAEAVLHNGLRACLGMVVADGASQWAGDTREYLAKGTAVRDQYRDNPLLNFAFVPQAPAQMPASLLREIRTLSDELDTPIQAHLHASATEVQQCLAQYGQRPVTRLAAAGWLTPNLNAVHMNQVTDADLAEFAGTGAHVIHCPEPGSSPASCPVATLLATGINVALGSENLADYGTFDLLYAMRGAALLVTESQAGANTGPAAALRMATLNGARALGLAEHTGSLIPGKWADMVAVDLDAAETQPLYNPLVQLVYGANSRQTSDVWVAGTPLLRKGAFTRFDIGDVLRRAREWPPRIAAATREVP